MTRIIAVVNQKGGVGKTTTTINLSSILAQETGKPVLAVDLDPQGNCSSGLGIEKNGFEKCVYNMLIEDTEAREVLQATVVDKLDILPASIQLAGAEIELVGELSRENKLKKALKPLTSKYEWIVIDCPPSLGLLTVNALTAATDLLIPLQCEYFALEGLTQLLNTVHLIQGDLNPDLNLLGVLLTMADHRTNLTSQIVDEVNEHFPQHVFKTIIGRNVKLSEAPSHGKPISMYDPKSAGAQHYREFTQELLECLKENAH